jgi:hypothetical protein
MSQLLPVFRVAKLRGLAILLRICYMGVSRRSIPRGRVEKKRPMT